MTFNIEECIRHMVDGQRAALGLPPLGQREDIALAQDEIPPFLLKANCCGHCGKLLNSLTVNRLMVDELCWHCYTAIDRDQEPADQYNREVGHE